MGNKSFILAQSVVHAEAGEVFASGEVVMVAYDYHTEKTMPILDEWRGIITEFESSQV